MERKRDGWGERKLGRERERDRQGERKISRQTRVGGRER